MRDIRPDLLERLKEIAADRARLDDDERAIRQLLRREENHFGEPRQESLALSESPTKKRVVSKRPTAEPSEKIQFITTTLGDRKAWPLELLVQAAQEKGINFNGKQPGRVLHFVLIGMQQRGLVKKVGDNDWIITSDGHGKSDAVASQKGASASLHS